MRMSLKQSNHLKNFYVLLGFHTDFNDYYYWKIFASIWCLLFITAATMLSFYDYISFLYLTYNALSPIDKLLLEFYLSCCVFKCFLLILILIFQQKHCCHLWNHIYKLNNQATELDLKYIYDLPLNLIIIFIPIIIHYYYGIKESTGVHIQIKQKFVLCCLFVIRLYEMLVQLKYLLILSLLKNNYKQLNKTLENSFQSQLTVTKRVNLLQKITKCHQTNTELVKFLNNIASILVLSRLVESFTRLTSYLYNLVDIILFSNTYLKIADSFINVFNAIFSICLLILPAESCSFQVRNLLSVN